LNEFKNLNAEKYFRWLFRRNETLDQVVFYFLSTVNATSPRLFPLFEASSKIRIVYIKGSRIPRTDLITSKLANILYRLAKKKIEKYGYVHIVTGTTCLKNKNQILHVDDPNYSILEKHFLQKWEIQLREKNLNPIIICTNNFTQAYLKAFLLETKILLIEQGFNDPNIHNEVIKYSTNKQNFSCVYSSPYIHVGRDKHANHGTWGADLLVNKVIPELFIREPSIEIHLIGEVGEFAKAKLKKFRNVVYHGRVSFEENMAISAQCSIGIYPRQNDFKRSMSKIFTYIGAGLPIVTFDLYDTEIVKNLDLGFSVTSLEEFISKIIYLKNNPKDLDKFRERISSIKAGYTWECLSAKMEAELTQ
jgi:glycosyltransferase involved in cell wall biosynthesis